VGATPKGEPVEELWFRLLVGALLMVAEVVVARFFRQVRGAAFA
jgi:hypothetical protein